MHKNTLQQKQAGLINLSAACFYYVIEIELNIERNINIYSWKEFYTY